MASHDGWLRPPSCEGHFCTPAAEISQKRQTSQPRSLFFNTMFTGFQGVICEVGLGGEPGGGSIGRTAQGGNGTRPAKRNPIVRGRGGRSAFGLGLCLCSLLVSIVGELKFIDVDCWFVGFIGFASCWYLNLLFRSSLSFVGFKGCFFWCCP